MPGSVREKGKPQTGGSVEAHLKHLPHVIGEQETQAEPGNVKQAAAAAEAATVVSVTPTGVVTGGPAAGPSAPYLERAVNRQKHSEQHVEHILGQVKTERVKRERQAHAFEADTLREIEGTQFKYHNGKVVTKDIVTTKLPPLKLKTAQVEAREAADHLKTQVKNGAIKPDQAIKQFSKAQKDILARSVVKVHETVPVPLHPKVLQHKIEKMHETKQKVLNGEEEYHRPKPDDNEGFLGDVVGAVESIPGKVLHGAEIQSGQTGVTSPIGAVVDDTVHKFLKGAATNEKIAAAGLPGTNLIENSRSAATHAVGSAIRTGFPVGVEYLQRPLLAAEAQFGKELVNPLSPGISGSLGQLLSQKQRRGLEEGANAWEAFAHGHKLKNLITGQELSEGLLKTKKLGIAFDLALDPTMYFGVGALNDITGEEAVSLLARIDREKPEILADDSHWKVLKRNADKSGDYQPLKTYLHDLAKKHDISVTHLGTHPDEQKAIGDLFGAKGERTKEIASLIERDLHGADVIKGRSTSMPGAATNKVAEEIGREAAGRARRPGFKINLMTPMGGHLSSLDFPLPEKLADSIRVPTLGIKGIKPEIRAVEAARQAESENAKLIPDIADAKQALHDARAAKHPNVAAAERKVSDLEDQFRRNAQVAEETAEKNFGWQTLTERSRSKNTKRLAHEIERGTKASANSFFHRSLAQADQILAPLDQKEREQVGAIMEFDTDTGTARELTDHVPLSPVVEDSVRKLYSFFGELQKYGEDIGSLKRAISEKYTPRQYTTKADITTNPRPVIPEEGASGAVSSQGHDSPFMHGRSVPHAGQIMDKVALSRNVERLFGVSSDEADNIADLWHDASIQRFALENLTHQLVRGAHITEDDLTPIEKQVVAAHGDWTSKGTKVGRVIRDPESTEGVLKLDPQVFKDTTDNPGLSRHAEQLMEGTIGNHELIKKSSALESRAKLEALVERSKNNPGLREHYEQLIDRTQAELDTYNKPEPETERLLPPAVTNQKPERGSWKKDGTTYTTVGARIDKEDGKYVLRFPGRVKTHGDIRDGFGSKVDENFMEPYASFPKLREAKEAYDAHVADPEHGFQNYMEYADAAGKPKLVKAEESLKNAQEALTTELTTADQIRQNMDKSLFKITLENSKGKVVKTLPNSFDTLAEARTFKKQLEDAGQLPPGVEARVEEDPAAKTIRDEARNELYTEQAPKVGAAEDAVVKAREEVAKVAKSGGKSKVSTIRHRPPPEVEYASEAPPGEAVGLPNDDELAEIVPDATRDYVGGLKDLRKEHPNLMLILDPKVSTFYRINSEKVQSMFRSRWRALDKRIGRSTTEAQGGRWTAADGSSGYTHELKADFGDIPEDKLVDLSDPVGYTLREDPAIFYPAGDIEFDHKSMIPISGRYYDTTTAREYMPVGEYGNGLGDILSDALGHDRIWPSDELKAIQEEYMRMGETGPKKLYDSAIQAGVEKFMTLSRFGLTTYFPAYHVRNMISDLWNAMLGDSGLIMHPLSNLKISLEAIRRGGKVKIGEDSFMDVERGTTHVEGIGDISNEGYLMIQDLFGLRSNLHTAEMLQLAEKGELTKLESWAQKRFWKRPAQEAKRGFGLGPSGKVGHFGLEVSSRREDIMRMVTFAQRLRRNGGDAADAAWWVIKHHFDYADLNPFEKSWMKTLFLFYTWYRKNIPLQFASMVTRPGFFSGVGSWYRDLAEGSTPLNQNWSKFEPWLPNFEGRVPDSGLIPPYYINQLGAATIDWNGHAAAFGFGAPFADTNLITNIFENPEEAADQFLNLTNPIFTTAIQFGTKTNLLTGQDLSGNETGGLANILSQVPILKGITGTDEEGNPTLPWATNLFLGQIPALNRTAGYFKAPSITEDTGFAARTLGGGLGSFLTGLTVYVGPKGGEREDAAFIGLVEGRGVQRRELLETKPSKKQVTEFDHETGEWARKLEVPNKYLHVLPGLGPQWYTSVEDRKNFKISSSGGILGSSPSNLAPLTSGNKGEVLGGLNTTGKPRPDYHSEFREAQELVKPGQGKVGQYEREQETTMTPLGGALGPQIPIGARSQEVKPQTPTRALLNVAEKRLAQNKAAAAVDKTVAQKPSKQKPNFALDQKGGARYFAQTRGEQGEKPGQKVAKHTEPPKLASKVSGPWLSDVAQGKAKQHQVKHFMSEYEKLKAKVEAHGLPQYTGFSNPDQEEFAKYFAKYTGLDPQFVGNWVAAEGGGSAGGGAGEAGLQNWLGVRYPGEQTAYSQSHFNGSAKQGAKEAAEWLKGEGDSAGTADEAAASIQEFKNMTNSSPQELVEYLEGGSGWGTGSISLDNIAYEGNEGSGDAKSKKALGAVEAKLTKLGVDPAKIAELESGTKQFVVPYKAFGKHVAKDLHRVTSSKGYTDDSSTTPIVIHGAHGGTLIREVQGSSGVASVIDKNKDPEIAARLLLLSAKTGKTIYVLSGYRTPEQAVSVGGYADDPHTKGEAFDIGVEGKTVSSADSISTAEYESVGLYRFAPGSSTEANHVELLNDGTPPTAGYEEGSSTAAGTTSAGGGTSAGSSAAPLLPGGSASKTAKELNTGGTKSPTQKVQNLLHGKNALVRGGLKGSVIKVKGFTPSATAGKKAMSIVEKVEAELAAKRTKERSAATQKSGPKYRLPARIK